jgi:hypothetical protein
MSAIATAYQISPYGGIDNTQNQFLVDGTIALSGNYGGAATHGDTLDLSKLGVASDQLPLKVEIWEQPTAGTGVSSGYEFVYCLGTTQANGLLQIINPTNLTEFTQGSAYGVTFPNTLRFRAFFPALT